MDVNIFVDSTEEQSDSTVCPPDFKERTYLVQAEEMQREGDLAGAVALYQQAIRINPASVAAWNNLGNVFASLKDWETARTFLREAERFGPESAIVLNNLGNVLERCGEAKESLGKYRAAVELAPANARFRNNLGSALRKANQSMAAEEMLLSAIGLRPGYAEAYANLAYLRYEQARLEEAEHLYRTAIELDPSYALGHTCLAHLLLSRGAFQEGWKEHEWRWKWEDFPSPQRSFPQPQWSGEPIAGQTILLHAEQGFGDTIQFVRYVPMVAALEAEVVLEVHFELISLMESLAGVSRLVARGDALPPFDLHCPLLSLPLAFETTIETVPGKVPYLRSQASDPMCMDRMAHTSPRVGLVWAGSPTNQIDGRRSLPFSALEVLFSVPGVKFYSFQREGESLDRVQRGRFEAVLPAVGDFAATAAALCSMDLLITVDTGLAHLGGALGLPVWILLPYVSDWRWLRDGTASPWYPRTELFRQTQEKQWIPLVLHVKEALLTWVAKRSIGRSPE